MDASTVVAIVAAVIALGSAVAAGLQVRIATQQTDLQRQIRQDAAQPYVFVDFRVNPVQAQLVVVHLENSGSTVATNVRISWDPPLPDQGDIPEGATAAPHHLPSMPPGRVLTWTLGRGSTLMHADIPKDFVVTIEVDGPFGAAPTLSYTLSLDDMHHILTLPDGSLARIEDAVKDLATSVEKATP